MTIIGCIKKLILLGLTVIKANIPKISKLRVGVLFGGKSIEREVSFNSGRTICDHIDSTEYEVIPIFQRFDGILFLLPWHFLHRGKIADFIDRLEAEAKKISWDDLKSLIDFMYIAVHGRFAEDGTLQGFLEVLGIPYLGAKVFGSSLGMNKIAQKEFLRINKIDVAKDAVFSSGEINNLSNNYCCPNEKISKKLKENKIDLPCIVKPVNEGSSFGISVVGKEKDLFLSIKKASECDKHFNQDVLVEEKWEGMEFVCVALQKFNLIKAQPSHKASRFAKASQDETAGTSSCQKKWFALPITQVIPEKDSGFFDYDQKYMPGRATKITPANCSEKDQKRIQDICIKASEVLNFSTISRIDGFLTKDGRVVLIDPNTLTGMGPATFLFHQAAEVGMSHSQLINYLIKIELQNYGKFNAAQKDKSNMKLKKQKIRVAVLLGGNSNEREVSLDSGRNICYKLAPEKYEVLPVFVNDKMELYKLNQKLLIQNSTREISQLITSDIKINWSDLPKFCDFVFIGLHGGAGENGEIQGTLEMLGLPYNGSGVLTSSLCMDKFKTAQFLRSKDFDVPYSFLVPKENWNAQKNKKDKKEFLNKLLKNINYPVIVKPHDDGCSVGVEKVKNISDLINHVEQFFKEYKKDFVLIEEFINAIELTCGVFGNDKPIALPPSLTVSKGEILSIKEKFLPGEGENITPAPLPEKDLKLIQKTMRDVYKTLGCKGYVRIDCFFQGSQKNEVKKNRVIILEINTLPGMTPATCIFHQAAEIGMKPMEFIDKIVELGFENHKKKIEFKQNNLETRITGF